MSSEARTPEVAADPALIYAGFWTRTGALAVDLLLMLVWAGPFRAAVRLAGPDPAVLGPFTVSGLLILGLLWAYFVVTTATTGGTLGKHLLGVRVVSHGFTRPDWQTVLFREVVGRVIVAATIGLGYVWAGVDPRKQGWHDKIADTLVVRRVAVVERGDPWEREPARAQRA